VAHVRRDPTREARSRSPSKYFEAAVTVRSCPPFLGGAVFFKLTGPEKTIAAHEKNFRLLLDSRQRDK